MAQDSTTKEKGDILENISVKLFSKMGYYDVKKRGGTGDGELTEILQLINLVWREWLFNANFFLMEIIWLQKI